MRTVLSPPIALALLISGALLGAEEAAAYKVIVNRANPQKTLKRSQVAAFFLKKQISWPNGTRVYPVDQSATSSIRAAFSNQVLGQVILGVQTYWQQQIFSGRDVPPPVKPSDREVMAFVQANPGAIGYVSAEATLLDGTQALTITE